MMVGLKFDVISVLEKKKKMNNQIKNLLIVICGILSLIIGLLTSILLTLHGISQLHILTVSVSIAAVCLSITSTVIKK